jgi:hypothetical protein
MDKELLATMSAMFFALLQGDMPRGEDMEFFTNHISSFTKVMNQQAIEALVIHGVEPEFAELVINGTVILNKMEGAQSYNDFCVTQEMAEMLGEE